MPSESVPRLLTSASNYAVVQLPGRNFPGVVFQGDSLHALLSAVGAVTESLRSGKVAKAQDQLSSIEEQLSQVLTHYKQAVLSERPALPF